MGELQTVWTWLPALYLFLGGLGAGAFITVSFLRLRFPRRFKATVTFGVWMAVGALAVGLCALVAEVEKPFQALVLFNSFVNPSSWMMIGAWLLFVTFAVFVLSALFTTEKIVIWLGGISKPLEKNRETINKVFTIIGIPLALLVAVYTGILLSAAPGIPLWNTWLLPVLFTVSALDTGVATISIFAVLVERDEGIGRVRRVFEGIIIVLVTLETIVLGVFVTTMLNGTTSEALSAHLLVEGPLSVSFWGLVVVVGLLVPFLLGVIQVVLSKRQGDTAVASALPVGGATCALVGGFSLRYLVLAAGIHAALVSPAVVQAMNGITFFVS